MTDELKPVRCGCGGEANIHKDDSTFGQMPIYTVSCNTCGMRSGRRSTEVQAVTAWNRAMSGNVKICTEDARWIPVTEALPVDGDIVLCTVEGWEDGKNLVYSHCRYMNGVWEMLDEVSYDYWTELNDVLAWREYPEPWFSLGNSEKTERYS